MDVNVNQSAEGKTFEFLGVESINTDFLKTFEFESKNQLITTKTDEFSAVCPFSGLPDIAKLVIIYKPTAGKCIELKSLKYYMTSFRNVGLYQEGCTKRIFDDLSKLLETKELYVKTVYNIRGGYLTTCEEGNLTFA